ncbi:uncharacterized protein FFNC_13240 [Fusarium fujikuroi]|nr:uncharacterized protein FFNC_13240 [Fusarium fujikuroi]
MDISQVFGDVVYAARLGIMQGPVR